MSREPPDFRLLTRNDGGPIATLCRVDSYARVVEPRVCDVWRGCGRGVERFFWLLMVLGWARHFRGMAWVCVRGGCGVVFAPRVVSLSVRDRVSEVARSP